MTVGIFGLGSMGSAYAPTCCQRASRMWVLIPQSWAADGNPFEDIGPWVVDCDVIIAVASPKVFGPVS